MADVVSGGDSSSFRWQDEADPELRPLVVKQLEATMDGLCRVLHKDRYPPDDLNQYIADFEEKTFQTAKDMIDYMKMISIRVSYGQKEAVQLKAKAAADRQKKMQMVHQMQRANMVQAIQGVNNSPFTTTPQAVPIMASPSWSPPFHSPNQHTACSVASNMNSNVNQEPSDMMAMLYQNFNSERATVAAVAPGIQSSQQIMQSIAMQAEIQSPAMQLQPSNIAQCHPASMVQLQGPQIARPNGHLNNLLGQNGWDCVQHMLPTGQQEKFWITQQQVGMHMQRYQMLGSNVGKTNTGYSGGCNNQQNAGWASGIQSPSKVCRQNMDPHSISPAQSQITVNMQSNLHCPLPPHESISQTRQKVVTTLSGGQNTHSDQLSGVTSPCFSYKSPGALQSSLNSNDVELCCTPSPISKFWIASPNESPKSRSQSPIAKQGHVAALSPCLSVKSALTSAEKTGFDAASPSTLVKTVSPSSIVKSGTVPAALPSDSDSSFLLENNGAVNGLKQAATIELSMPVPPTDQAADQDHGRAETPVPKMPAPAADQAEDQEHGDAETPVAKTPAPSADEAEEDQEHGGAETPVAKTPAPPADQVKDQEHGGVETPVAQKPIDRLIAAVLSSSPAALLSSFNLMKSAIIDMDSVPLPIGPNNKMKRVYAVISTSESPTLTNTDGSTVTSKSNASDATSSDATSSGYHIAKRQKPQNAKDALLDEIKAVNSTLIDTLISITSEDGADGINLCNGTTLIKLSYTAVSLAPDLKSKFGVSGNFQPLVMPTTLSIPADYPRSSPVIVDNEGDASQIYRNKFSSISLAVDRAFRFALLNLQEPRSLKEIARAWNSCVRRAVTEYVYQLGGDTNLKSLPVSLCQGWVKG